MLSYIAEGCCKVEHSSSVILCFVVGFNREREAAERAGRAGQQSDSSAAGAAGRTDFNSSAAQPCATRVGELTDSCLFLVFNKQYFSLHI